MKQTTAQEASPATAENATLPTDSQVISAMARYGGSFVQGLAIAARRADSVNLRKIKNTWSEYWAQYEQLAMMDMQRKGDTK